MKVGFIGCGTMGSALVTAVTKVVDSCDIYVFDNDMAKVQILNETMGLNICSDAEEIANAVDYLFLAVKPTHVSDVLTDITTKVSEEKMPLIISIAAGLEIAKLERLALTSCRFIRLMPNLPATVGEAMIALSANSNITKQEISDVKKMLADAGSVEQVPESLMDCVTGVSGSGPAYGFVFIEAMADAAVKFGMPRNQAYIYAAQTLKGAATMVLETKKHPAELKDAVCSPGGTTIAGVAALEENNFRNAIIKAVTAATERSKEMGGR